MKTQVCLLLVLLSLGGTVFADRMLERTEIDQIFKVLTEQPQKTWISSGTIHANREEYKAPKAYLGENIDDKIEQEISSYRNNPEKKQLTEKAQQKKINAIPFNVRYHMFNESKMDSRVIIKYDGDKFYWEIIVDSREDSITPEGDDIDNYYTEEFDLGWNQRRVFAWDGDKNIRYYRPGNQAIIEEEKGEVNGALTAGIIPWGYGKYSYEYLLKTTYSAIEIESNNEIEIHLSIVDENRNEFIILIPSQKYSVKYYSSDNGKGITKVCTYNNYEIVGDKWCPNNIMIETYDQSVIPRKLVSYDSWEFTSISNEPTETDDFVVQYDYDALIDDYRFGEERFRFRYDVPENMFESGIDVSKLIKERLDILNIKETMVQNCATVSLKYVCNQLGREMAWQELSPLVDRENKSTNILEIQEYIRGLGLYSQAVRTDLEKIKSLEDCQIILHLPDISHYVVFANADNDYVRLIDLDQNNMYYRKSKEYFSKKWDGTAIIVDNEPIQLDHSYAKLNNNTLSQIIGASSCQQCNVQIQRQGIDVCQGDGAGCGDEYKKVYKVMGCGDANSGSCRDNEEEIEYEGRSCLVDINLECSPHGEWYSNPITACDSSYDEPE